MRCATSAPSMPRKPERLFWSTVLMLALLKPLSHAGDASSQPSDELWSRGVDQFEKSDYTQAADSFETWIAQAESAGVVSAEAHENLALSLWQAKKPGPAVFHLLKATSCRDTPWEILKNVDLVSEIQLRLGVRESWTDSLSFRLASLLPRNPTLGLVAIAFWFLCLTPVMLITKRPAPWLWKPTLLAGSALSVLVVISILNRKLSYNPAVLISSQESVNLYRTHTPGQNDTLAELPSGTVVNVERSEGEFKRINSPVAGWIRANDVKSLN